MRQVKTDYSKLFDDNHGSSSSVMFFKENEKVYKLVTHNLYCGLESVDLRTKEKTEIIFMQNIDDIADFADFAGIPKKYRSDYGSTFSDLDGYPLQAVKFLRQWENC